MACGPQQRPYLQRFTHGSPWHAVLSQEAAPLSSRSSSSGRTKLNMLQDYERFFPTLESTSFYTKLGKRSQITHRQDDAAEKKKKNIPAPCAHPIAGSAAFPGVLFLNSPAAEEMPRGMSVSALWDAQNSTPWWAYGLIGCWRACLASPCFPKRGRIETCIPTHALLPRNDRKPVVAFMDGEYLQSK